MQRYMRPFLGGFAGLVLVTASCAQDPGISSAGGGGSTGGGPSGGGSAGRGGSGSGGGRAGNSGGGGAGGQPNFTFNLDGSSGGNRDGGPAASGMDAACGFQKYELERLPPELLLVLDRSGSMKTTVPGTNNNRWVEVTAALDEMLTLTNNVVSWGLKLYPTTSGCNVSNNVEVEINAASMPTATGIKASMPNDDQGGTPTPMAVTTGTSYLMTRTTKNPKYIVLATDGEPTCPSSGSAAATMSVAAVTAAKAAGFNTFVVGIATSGTGADTTLNNMAMAGGEPRPGMPKYYPVANKADLVEVLKQITVRVSNCVFPLDKAPPSPMDVAVNVGGMRLTMGQWMYGPNMRSIEVTGAVCETLKAGMVADVQIIFGCPNVPIP